jgi:hypothetical protein
MPDGAAIVVEQRRGKYLTFTARPVLGINAWIEKWQKSGQSLGPVLQGLYGAAPLELRPPPLPGHAGGTGDDSDSQRGHQSREQRPVATLALHDGNLAQGAGEHRLTPQVAPRVGRKTGRIRVSTTGLPGHCFQADSLEVGGDRRV